MPLQGHLLYLRFVHFLLAISWITFFSKRIKNLVDRGLDFSEECSLIEE